MSPQFGPIHLRECYRSHPPLPLGKELFIYGGSCIEPAVLDADIYIGFDRAMKRTERSFPWTDGWEVCYPVVDRGVPSYPQNFRKLVEWTAEQLRAGKKVHAGCIGGHGRTGTFFVALVAHMLPEVEDPVGYVREHYCEKAVETDEQIAFLLEHFGSGDRREK